MGNKRVLIAVLDWGLGHATRCVPIIRKLLENNMEVFIAGSGLSLNLLKKEFPLLKAIELPSYNPQYSRSGFMAMRLGIQIPHFLATIRLEHLEVQRLVKKHSIDCIISDNRYGCYSPRVRSIFLTHQLTICLPRALRLFRGAINWLNAYYIRKYDECWVPDLPGSIMTGRLSASGQVNKKYIGVLSRFKSAKADSFKNAVFAYDLCFLLSGPEPQRTILEEIFLSQLKGSSLRIALVRGTSAPGTIPENENVQVHNMLTSSALELLLNTSGIVIARSGYSTVMDLLTLGKKAIFIPTPGQTEQEYLASKLEAEGVAFCMQQHTFDLRKALLEAQRYQGFSETLTQDLLEDNIQNLLKRI